MGEPQVQAEMKTRWKKFVDAVAYILQGTPEHRHEDQFLAIKEQALDLARGQKMIDEVATGYANALETSDHQPSAAADAVRITGNELDAFVLATQVHESQEKAGKTQPGARKSLCAAVKTIMGSVKELFALTPFGKGVLEVLKEAVELVGGG